MSFNYDLLLTPPVEAEFKPTPETPDGEGLQLQVNLDRLTLDFLEEAERGISEIEKSVADEMGKAPAKKSKKTENKNLSDFSFQLRSIRSDIEFKSRVLGGKPGENNPDDRAIRGWNMERNGVAVPVSYETISRMHQTVIDKLYKFITEDLPSVKKNSDSKSDNS